MKRTANLRWVALAACLVTANAFGQASEKTDRMPLEARLANLEMLIERSSAARHIEASGVKEAGERRASAADALRRARQALRDGDAAASEQLLAQARALMVEASRLAAPEKLVADKARLDFDARLESVKALLSAHQRISLEKNDNGGAETTRSIQKLIDGASRLKAEGRMEGARQQLDQAYLIAKASVSSMRSGDTLVRSLNFASKEEEYHYEIDRNDTHQMLIKVLLEGRRDKPGVESMVSGRIERARQVRAQAEQAAARGDHAAAIELLEESTGELVRAIRSAGVYIPG